VGVLVNCSFPFQKDISKTVVGAQCAIDGDVVSPKNIEINGNYIHRLLGGDEFSGTFSVDGYDYTSSSNSTVWLKAQAHFGTSWDKNKGLLICYPANDKNEAIELFNRMASKPEGKEMLSRNFPPMF
jgi:hypothetical protein